ncbi:MAG: arginine--tRNA ligase [Chloroflexi bacterium]|nr:arginine--tRNA ligase [Chloroflexota bacterium]
MQPLHHRLVSLLIDSLNNTQAAGDLPALDSPAAIALDRPKKPEWGNYSTPLALGLARSARLPPLEVASRLLKHLPPSELIAQATTSAPGFINLTLNPAWVAAQVEAILAAGPGFADFDLGGGAKAMVEFVSANPTGPLSVGRGRGGVIGDTVANLLAAAGYDVTREYYFNNAGKQMRDLAESLRLRYAQALGQEVEFPESYYQGEYLTDLGRRLASERGDSLAAAEWTAFKEIAESAMFDSIKGTLSRLRIYMDVFFNENSLYDDGSVWDVVRELRERGHAYDSEGAVWFKATAFGGTEDRVIVKSTGEPTYRLPDIAYHRNKLGRGFALVVDVLGADHKDAFPDVLRGVQALGLDPSGIQMLMNQFVTLKGEKMSTRAGRFTLLDELVDEVGADVVRFFMLMRSAESHLEFDLDLAKEQSEKNPVYYVQYAHTRIAGILRKAQAAGHTADGGDVSRLTHPGEQALIRKILELPDVIELALKDLAPHHLPYYAQELATIFHGFYRDCQVLPSENQPVDPATTKARLKLVSAAKIGLARALGLMGVSAPEMM